MNEREKLMKNVMMYDFALIDTAEYLDSHPECRDAADYFYSTRVLFRGAVKDFEEKFGPLSHDGENMTGKNGWCWVETPWPWELGE